MIRVRLLAVSTAILGCLASGAAAQSTGGGYAPPRNAFGQPDLSGFWSNATLTPTVRPSQFGARGAYTEDEVKVIESGAVASEQAANARTDVSNIRVEASGDVGGYNRGWLDPGNSVMRVKGQARNSIITTPDGRYPPRKGEPPPPAPAMPNPAEIRMTSAALLGSGENRGPSQGNVANQLELYRRGTFDNPETRSYGERCLASFGRNGPPPMFSNGLYNNNYQFSQSRDAVAIHIEMVHDTRIIRLNARHRTDGVREWFGDSIGRFEGDTLVVETINLPAAQAYLGAWENLKVTERFTRVAPDRLHYQFTVEDPTVWDKPWGGEYEFSVLDGRVMEYACHEGNHAMEGILAGARQEDLRTGR